MDRESLMNSIRQGPVEVAMNDGQKITIPGSEFCLVDDIAAHILCRREDGSFHTKIASLDCMATITPISSPSR